MKTIEEKVKAYDEALERARSWIKDECEPSTKKCLELLFPELRESKDERILKCLEKIVNWGCAKNISAEYGVELKDVKSWLEKQKKTIDSITASRITIRPDGGIERPTIGYLEKQKEQKPTMIQWNGKNLKEVIDFTGKSNKFGEWFKSWEDYENYVHSHGDIFKLFCEDGSHYEVPVGAWIVKTPDGYNIPSRFRFVQKPAERSEEDEKMRNLALDWAETLAGQCSFVGINPTDFRKIISWLKSLRPQSKVEWSEKDKQWLSEVYFAIDHSMYSEVERQAMKKYIDYLRYQSRPKQEWSEEDIEAFVKSYSDSLPICGEFQSYHDALVHAYRQGVVNTLKSFHPQPKKSGIVLTEEQEKEFGHLFSYPHLKLSEEQICTLERICSNLHLRASDDAPKLDEIIKLLKQK